MAPERERERQRERERERMPTPGDGGLCASMALSGRLMDFEALEVCRCQSYVLSLKFS